MRTRLAVLASLLTFSVASSAHAQGKGFQLDRYEPTTAGEYSFMVDKPWYSSTRWFAAGLTLDYANEPLTYGYRDSNGQYHHQGSIVSNALMGHVDVAGSFLDRVTLSASLPVLFHEWGHTVDGISPDRSGAVGDPRFGAMVRLWKHADRDPFSIHVALDVWAPIKWKDDQGDRGVRVMPKLVLSGYAAHVAWSFTGAYYYRPQSYIGDVKERGTIIGSELQLGGAIAYADYKNGFQIGPEALLSTVVQGGDAFSKSFTSLEILLGAHFMVKHTVLLGASVGMGILKEPGTPDFRALLRAAYAPVRHARSQPKDTDGDGIPDEMDRCPTEPEDKDGFEDADGCPDPDNDRDGILDINDKCPNDPEDKDGFEDEDGCPDPDNDKDGILDVNDRCPNDPEDKDGFQDEDGCPDPDNDKDGVLDINDKCPLQAGPVENQGCPDPDRDGDTVVDRLDNCPDEPGDPANHGCKKKQLVEIKNGRIEILEQVFFATDKDIIQPRSFNLLRNVAEVLTSHPDLRVRIEGHTDSQGKLAHNMDLSQRRAESVRKFLIVEKIDGARLEAKGYGPTQPLADNKTSAGRALNRRVVFTLLGDAAGIEQTTPTAAPRE